MVSAKKLIRYNEFMLNQNLKIFENLNEVDAGTQLFTVEQKVISRKIPACFYCVSITINDL